MSCFVSKKLSNEDAPSKPTSSDTPSEALQPSDNDGSDSTLNAAYRKVDLRLILWYSLVLFFLSIESHNVANAAIMNVEAGTDIQHQLGDLTSEQWALVLSISHYPYLVFEPFTTFLLKRFSPRKWMSRIMLSWGIIAMCNAATQNFGGLIACRFLLGLAEAGFFPGVLYHLSFWYPTSRLPFRIALFAATGALAAAVSGLLAFAVSFLNGMAGLAGWRYLFIIEGAPSIICGILSWFLLPDFPEDASFLTDEQRTRILGALPRTQPNAQDETCSWAQIKGALKDPTTTLFFLIPACHVVGSRGVTSVLPTVLLGLGIAGSGTTQLLTMPPYVGGAFALLISGWLVRKRNWNCWWIAISLEAVCCVCYIILIAVQAPLAKYALIIVATTAGASVMPILWPERIRAAHGASSAALGIGLTATAPILHGIIGPQIYQKSFGPSYRVSYAASVALLATVIVCIVATWIIIKRRDQRENQEDEGSESEKEQQED